MISVRKTIPASSDWYTTGGDQTIELAGMTKLIFHSKKELIKINRRVTKAKAIANPSDKFPNSVKDLKNGTDDIKISGWIEDDDVDTAWEKYWRLRAMCSGGGALTNLTINNVVFSSSTQECFLEDIVGTIIPDDTGAINVSSGDGVARIELILTFFIGAER